MRYPYDKYTITAKYKQKGRLWSKGYHTGTDFVGKEKEVKAICNGTIRVAKYDVDYGYYYSIQSEDNTRILYCHFKTLNFKKGDIIKEGDILGTEGRTGHVTGSHLHLEIRVPPYTSYNTIDPIEYLERGIKMFSWKNEAGIYVIKIPVDKFNIVMWNKAKKTTKIKNYCNAGFFASGKLTTEPMGNLIVNGKVESETINSYGNLANKKLHTLCIDKNNQITLELCKQLERDKYKYAISGLPVTLNSEDVSWKNVCKPQGWTGGELRATKHICISYDNENIYIFGLETTAKQPGTAITQIYKKLKHTGLKNILKLDGGGSFVIDINGKNVDVTSENRRVNNLITFE